MIYAMSGNESVTLNSGAALAFASFRRATADHNYYFSSIFAARSK